MITTKGKTFTIERSKWLRGEGSTASRLLRIQDSKMCCLGQVCSQLGFRDETLLNQPTPASLEEEIEGICHILNSIEVSKMMAVNDEFRKSDDERESRLSELAQQAGFSLKFVD